MDDQLTDSVSQLLERAATRATTAPASADLRAALQRLRGPLRIAVAGKVKAGKSTLLNALLGEELAPTDAGECTQIVTWYRRGADRQVVIVPKIGPPTPAVFSLAGALDINLGAHAPADIDRLEVSWPTGRLDEVTIIDTPGIASISSDVSERTLRVLTPDDDRVPVVDAVLYLLRHTHASDFRFLESFHDDELAHGTPMNAVGVLSRADEIGGCRLDAMEVAERVGNRYQREPRLRRLCPVVVPVAGLLGLAGVTLRESEFRALRVLARADPGEIGELLLTADRLDRRVTPVPVTELERQHLQVRLGLFGVRLSVELIRDGQAPTAADLSRELMRRSGFDRLQSVLSRQFTQRSNVLKARSALAVLGSVLRAGGCSDADRLTALAEQITGGAHEFEEMRLLDQLRTSRITLPQPQADELDRLLGGSGHDAATRLDLSGDPTADEVCAAALEALGRWRAVAEHPLANRFVQAAARGVQRTLEGIVTDAGAAEPGD